MFEQRQRYYSYLLRIWLVEDSENPVWRASLENAASGQSFGFGNLEELKEFLKLLTDQSNPIYERPKAH